MSSEPRLEVHRPTGIVTVPFYVGEALSRLCDVTRRLERDRIADYLDAHKESQGKSFAQDIREGRHHD